MPVKLTDTSEPATVLYYGDGGSGKTTAAVGMANLGRVLVVNAEGGLKASALKRRGIKTENIEVFPGPDEELTYGGLELEWGRLSTLLAKEPGAYAGVVWDSISEIVQRLLAQVAHRAVQAAGARGRTRNAWSREQSDYQETTEQIRDLFRKYRDLPCHFATTALVRRETEDDGTIMYQPGVNPALQNDIHLWCDIVGYTDVAKVGDAEQYRGHFRAVEKLRGKDRFDILPPALVDPSFDRLVGYIDGEIVADKDPVMTAAKKAVDAMRAETAGSAVDKKTKETK